MLQLISGFSLLISGRLGRSVVTVEVVAVKVVVVGVVGLNGCTGGNGSRVPRLKPPIGPTRKLCKSVCTLV